METRTINNATLHIRELIRVRLTAQLRDYAHGAREIELDTASNLQAMVGKLDRSFPGIGGRIVDDQGRIRAHVNVFVNAENSRELENEKTPLRDGDVVHILPSVSGG
jgi:MoaD family protein